MKAVKSVHLGSIITISKGKKHSIADEPSAASRRLIGIDDLRNDKLIRYTNDRNGTEIVPEDLLIAWDGANAGTIGYGKTGFIGSTLARLRIRERKRFFTPFLGLFLQSKFDYLRKTATGATIPHINRQALERIVLPDIDFDDQIRIAHLLSKVEGLIAQRKQHLQQLDDLLKSIFLEMFGDPVRNEKEWEIRCCDKIITNIQSGTSYGGEEKEFLDGDEYGVLKISAVTEGYFNPREFKAVKKSAIRKVLRFVRKGDLLFSRANTIELVAACCIVNQDSNSLFLPDKLWALTLDGSVNIQFFNYLLKNDNFRNLARKQASGGHDSMLNISMKKFLSLSAPVPNLEVQNQFATIVEKVETIKSSYQQSLTELENLYGALSQKAFKGELDLSRVPLDSKLENDKTDKNHENRMRVTV